MQKPVRAKGHNYDQTPVAIQRASVTLIETFFAPTQLPLGSARVKQTRVRYANRAGLTPSSLVLDGEVVCRNQSRQEIEALELTVVLLDAFHQPIGGVKQEPVTVHRVSQRLPARSEQAIAWEQQIESLDVYEVAVVVTRARFTDGTLWQAPEEELIDF
jgi:hypothetical protein